MKLFAMSRSSSRASIRASSFKASFLSSMPVKTFLERRVYLLIRSRFTVNMRNILIKPFLAEKTILVFVSRLSVEEEGN